MSGDYSSLACVSSMQTDSPARPEPRQNKHHPKHPKAKPHNPRHKPAREALHALAACAKQEKTKGVVRRGGAVRRNPVASKQATLLQQLCEVVWKADAALVCGTLKLTFCQGTPYPYM